MRTSAARINLLHDPLRPLNARSNQLVGARASLRAAEQIVRRLHVQTGQDRRSALRRCGSAQTCPEISASMDLTRSGST
jgi:hypothetical protein